MPCYVWHGAWIFKQSVVMGKPFKPYDRDRYIVIGAQ